MASIRDLCNSDEEGEASRPSPKEHNPEHPPQWSSSSPAHHSSHHHQQPHHPEQQQHLRQPHPHSYYGHHHPQYYNHPSQQPPHYERPHESGHSSYYRDPRFIESSTSRTSNRDDSAYAPSHPRPPQSHPHSTSSGFAPMAPYSHAPHPHPHPRHHQTSSSSSNSSTSPRTAHTAIHDVRNGRHRSLSTSSSPLRSTPDHHHHHHHHHSHPHPHPYHSRPKSHRQSHDSNAGASDRHNPHQESMVKHESVTEEGRRECKKEDRMQHINDEEMSSPSQAHHPRVPKVDSSTASGSTSKRTVKVAPEDRIPRRTATIKIVQQPLHARMCGFGEKDRRPVDPPPIVQLLIDNGESPPDPDYNLFKLPQKKKLSAAAKRKKALAMGATSSSSSSGKATRSTRRSSETKTSRKHSESDDDEEGSNESDHDDHDSESEHSGSDSEDEERKGSSRHAKAAAAAATAMDTEIPRWEDFYENRDTGAIPLALDPLFVLHCSLWSHDGSEVRNMVATPSGSVSSSGAASHRREKASAAMAGASPMPPKLTRILMGSVVVSPILLFNEKGEQGWYFSFPDLSIRTEGVYTLKFSLLRLGSFDFMSPAENDEDSSPVIAEATSEPFTVFSAKKFPGMTESTLLSKAFARQGLKIPIRNDLRVRKNADKD